MSSDEEAETSNAHDNVVNESEEDIEQPSEEEEEDDEEIQSPKSPKRYNSWADLFSDDEGHPVVEVEERQFKNDEGVIKIGQEQSCCGYVTYDSTVCQALMLAQIIPEYVNVSCTINALRNYVNYCAQKYTNLELNETECMNLLDNYMRFRHDSLASYMIRCFGKSFVKTDVKFKEVFDIDSHRTPDFILTSKNGYIILEVAAVSNPERAYKKKGHERYGYTPKYSKEIALIRSKGTVVDYIVVVFDVSDITNQDYLIDLNKVASMLDFDMPKENIFDLEYLRKEYITTTEVILNLFSAYLTPLYGTPYELAVESSIEETGLFGDPVKKYSGKYKRVGVSNSIYDRVVSICPKLDYMLSKLDKEEKQGKRRYVLCFEQLNNTFKFSFNNQGAKAIEWYKNINNQSIAWICDNLKIYLKNVEVKSPKADFEFMSYERTKDSVIEGQDLLYEYISGHNRTKVVEEKEMDNYDKKVKMIRTLRLECKYEDEDLESKIIQSINQCDKTFVDEDRFVNNLKNLDFKPLCTYTVNNDAFYKAIRDFNSKMLTKNSLSDSVTIIPHAKPPFIYPLCQINTGDYVSYKDKPEVLKHLVGIDLGPYTNMIIKVAASDGFSFGPTQTQLNHKYEECKLELSKYNKQVMGELKELFKSKNMETFPTMQKLDNYEIHRKKLQELNLQLHKVAQENGVENKNLGIITMSKGINSESSTNFKKEMEHFRTQGSKSHYKGVGMQFDGNYLDSLFYNLKEALLSPSEVICPDPIYDEHVAEDSNLLKQMKKDIMDQNKEHYLSLRSTNFYHSAAFISRLCHTLMFHSQSSLNSTKIVVDNLGYKNVLCIIKGGKKIFSTKKSKLFRLIYPTYSPLSKLYCPSTLPSSHSIHILDGRTFLVTPWLNYHETIVADGITFLHRLMGFSMLSKVRGLDFLQNMDRIYFNLILAVHNRRQTETMLHNLRYISMNCMSEASAIEEILPEMADFNYDFFQCWVRNQISVNFLEFAQGLKTLHDTSKNSKIVDFRKVGLKNIFNRNKIEDVNTLALSIYSSYLMSKAPTTQSLEQVKNMKSIMKTHEEFLNTKGEVEKCFVTLDKGFLDYANELNESDFNLDPSYCFLLGKFMGDYLGTLEKKSKLIQKWDSVLDSPWDEMANTKGLRGDNEDFFGNKGYYIVYREVLEGNKCKELMDVLESDMEPYDKEKIVKEMNETYRNRIKNKPLDKVIFHVVDKVQRGGSREIYVMDKETKVHQQVIEDYTKYLCKLIPNEMISIPSNKRLQHIHSKVFEGGKDFNEKYYWVLDCRKWAPKSIVEKFILFIMGAKDSLPESFVIHALNFFNMMLKKRVYTRPHVVEIMSKSIAGEKYKKYFKIDDQKKAYYFDMPYSWVMGIFNYFSSFMHVATQLHAAHVIRISTHNSYGVDNLLHMVAHSDDSAGKIMVNNKSQMLRASFIYEVLMHASNHLLSKKKCNQGKVYYEFISILYIGGSLLSLLSKFTGMFNYHPTDKGYCNDITDAYSKSTELLLNGATFEQSYLAMKIQTQLIYRFYFGKSIAVNYYEMPPALFGIPDAHPLMALMCGSDADTFRIFKTSSLEYKKLICLIDKNLLPLTVERSGLIKAFQSVPRVYPNRKLQNMQDSLTITDNFKDSWTFKNVKFKNTYLNAIQFINKLNDKTFLAALQDETLTRRLSRSYFFRSHLTVKTSHGDMHPKEIREIIFLMKRVLTRNYEGLKPHHAKILKDVENDDTFGESGFDTIDNLFNFIYCEVSRLHDYFQKINYKAEDVVENRKTTKPIYITLQKTAEECPVDYNPQSLCSWIKEPEHRHLLPDTRGFNTAENFVSNTMKAFSLDLKSLPVEQLFPILQKVKRRSKSEYFCYSNLPSDLREISTYQDVLNFLSHNTFQDKMINGISVQFGKTITAPMEHMNQALEDDDLQYTISLCVLCNAIVNSKDYDPDMLGVDFETPEFLKIPMKEIDLKHLTELSMNYWDRMPNTSKYTKSLFCLTRQSLLGNKSFDANLITDTYFNSFIKRQLLIDNVWLGTGKLFLSLGNIRIVLLIQNMRVIKALTQVHEYIFDLDQVCYINMCLHDSQLPRLQEAMVRTSVEDWGLQGLCYNEGGEYYIGDVRGSFKHIPAQLDANLTTPLSNLENGRVRSFKGGKMVWEAFVDNRKVSYQLNTLPIEIRNSVSLLKGKMLENLKNKRILSADLDCVSYLVEVCAKELDLERFVNVENVVKNYHLTDIFKVMKSCHSLSLCTVVDPEIKATNYPACDGGLLNMFISYANFDHNFDFKWHRTVTPEYMMLKSAQPGSFMSELSGSIKEKFDNLYTTEDKEIIHKSLSNLAQGFLDGKEEKLLNLLCTWGYAGVAGALEEMAEGTSIKSFEKIRLYSPDSPYISLFENLYLKIIFALFSSYKFGLSMNEFIKVESLNFPLKVNERNLNYHLMSTIHSVVLQEYRTGQTDKWVYNPHNHLTSLMLTCVIENKQTAADFHKRLSDNTILRNLPTTKEAHREWQIALNTCRMIYITMKTKQYELDFHIRRDLSVDLINPYVLTRDIMLTQGVKIEASRLFHYGGVSNHLYDILTKDFVESFKDVTVFFKMKKIDINDLKETVEFVYNQEWFPKRKLTEEFLESDEYDEARTELQSSEIDTAYVEEQFSDYRSNEEKSPYEHIKRNMVKVVVKGKPMNVLKYELNFIILMGGNLNLDIYDRLRMSGEDVLILTDCVPLRLISNSSLKIFKSRNTAWHGHCILNPESLYYVVISHDIDDISFWSRVLESDPLDLNEFDSIRTSTYFDYRNDKGNVINIDKLVAKDGVWDIITADMEVDEEEAERERLLKEKDTPVEEKSTDEVAKVMEDEGLEPDQILKYKSVAENPKDKKSWEDVFSAFAKMDDTKKEESLKGGIKEAIDEVIKKPKSAQQHEMIMQVPKVFGGGRERGIPVKNNLFRERKIIAEVESMCPGLIWKVLSGSLYISQLTYNMFKNQLLMYQTLVKGVTHHKKGKQFLINICKLILNDAKIVPNPDDDFEIWRSVTDITLRLMLLDENEEGSSESSFIEEEADVGILNYGISGLTKLFHQ